MRTRQLEKERTKNPDRDEGPIRPFGESEHDLEVEWLEWKDYVLLLNEGKDPARADVGDEDEE